MHSLSGSATLNFWTQLHVRDSFATRVSSNKFCTNLHREQEEAKGSWRYNKQQNRSQMLELKKSLLAVKQSLKHGSIGDDERLLDQLQSLLTAATAYTASNNSFPSTANGENTVDQSLQQNGYGGGQQEWESDLEKLEGKDVGHALSRQLQQEKIASKEDGLSTMRRLKKLDVHDYVHGALRASHMRSWLQSRSIQE